ncbi:hypothetical protein L1887_23840 [Cichorium endivia]|nr:hypothetical protein L1887_23840 [Cichorium endivia]
MARFDRDVVKSKTLSTLIETPIRNDKPSYGLTSYANIVRGKQDAYVVVEKIANVDSKIVMKEDVSDNMIFPLSLLGCFKDFCFLVFNLIMVSLHGMDYIVPAKELCSLTPDFLVDYIDEERRDLVGDERSQDGEYDKESTLEFVVDTFENVLGMASVNDAKEEDGVLVYSNVDMIVEENTDVNPWS